VSKANELFVNFIQEKYGNAVFSAVKHFCIVNREEIGERLCNSGTLSYIQVDDLRYRDAFISKAADGQIEFDLLIDPELSARIRYDGDYYETEPLGSLWLTVSCSAKIDDVGMKGFQIINTDEYSRSSFKRPLSGDLVPFIKKDDYNRVAEEILTRYLPQALETPCPVNIHELVKNMGLKLLNREITLDGSIFGQLYFSDSVGTFYNSTTREKYTEEISARTIVIDTSATSVYSFGSENITIAHECVHAALHREAFSFAKVLNKSLQVIQCQSDGSIRGEIDGDTLSWMERQANGIAPYLLMPSKTLLIKANELLSLYSSFPDYDPLIYTERIVREIAKFFGVTAYAARKRLIDLGFEDAIGCLNWIQEKHIFAPAYLFKKGSLKSNETYTVEFKDIFQNIIKSQRLLEGFATGKLVFVENHVCINDHKYCLSPFPGELVLTDYARRHLDECCLKFELSSLSGDTDHAISSSCYLCRDCGHGLHFRLDLSKENSADEKKQSAENFLAYSKEINDMRQFSILPLSEFLTKLLEYRGYEIKELSDESGISERELGRYLNGKIVQPNKRTLIAICHGLHLYEQISALVLERAGIKFIAGSKEDDAFEAVLCGMRENDIDEVNGFLIDLNFDPLSKDS
jgi:transcriptional regulator with XRE-family HTH domain